VVWYFSSCWCVYIRKFSKKKEAFSLIEFQLICLHCAVLSELCVKFRGKTITFPKHSFVVSLYYIDIGMSATGKGTNT